MPPVQSRHLAYMLACLTTNPLCQNDRGASDGLGPVYLGLFGLGAGFGPNAMGLVGPRA